MDAEAAACFAVRHSPTVEEGVQAGGEILGHPPAGLIVGEPPEREDRVVARVDGVRTEPRAPELDERRILPAGRVSPLDACVDREDRGARHAVLQARPRRTPERARAGWEPLVERADVPPEREDLRPREVEPSQSGYSSFRHERGTSGCSFGVRSSRKAKYGWTNGSGADTVYVW